MDEKNAIIISDSISNGNRITSYLLTVPQIIVKELLRHRMFSFSSSSMRAIPFNKVLGDIRENMFVPLAFQSHHSGMQGSEYLMGEESEKAKQQWIESGLRACEEAERLYNLGVTKQLCSRIIEPFGYAKILITATEFENFFELRCPNYIAGVKEGQDKYRSRKDVLKDFAYEDASEDFWRNINTSQAEIHIQALTEAMWDARNESVPKELKEGEWHIPFSDKISYKELNNIIVKHGFKNLTLSKHQKLHKELALKISIARCARLSYMTFDGEIDYEKDIQLHDQLLASHHMSPFEHCAKTMSEDERAYYYKSNGPDPEDFETGWCRNFRGFIQYRYLIENSL